MAAIFINRISSWSRELIYLVASVRLPVWPARLEQRRIIISPMCLSVISGCMQILKGADAVDRLLIFA